jgi:hypothetical protein
MVLLLAMAGLMGCTDIVDKGPNRIAIAVPSAYKLDNARLRADRYCERQSGTHATLVRTDGVGHDGVAYFRCES